MGRNGVTLRGVLLFGVYGEVLFNACQIVSGQTNVFDDPPPFKQYDAVTDLGNVVQVVAG